MAAENDRGPVQFLPGQRLQDVCQPGEFLPLIRPAPEDHRIPRRGGGPDLLGDPFPVLSDDQGRLLYDRPAAAVIGLQKDPPAARKVSDKAGHDPGIGPAEAVNGLVIVPDSKEIGPVAGQQPQQGILVPVDVLVFVHQEKREPGHPAAAGVPVPLQQPAAFRDHIIQVYTGGFFEKGPVGTQGPAEKTGISHGRGRGKIPAAAGFVT